jgi:cytochrome c peroxidase
MKHIRPIFLFGVLSLALSVEHVGAAQRISDMKDFSNAAGSARTFSPSGALDQRNPFFQNLGSNGRACVTCHQPDQGWSMTPADLRRRFDQTDGLDPVFRLNDGSVCPNADVSDVAARRNAYALLLTKGLIRVGIGIPANAEFELAAVQDPYGYASSRELSLFRRPLPSANLRFLSAVMWDGRESVTDATLQSELLQQALDATQGHAQLAGQLTQQQLQDIVDFEMDLTAAQSADLQAGKLDTQGARGGPISLYFEDFFIGINDPLGGNPTGAAFDRGSMTLFAAWENLRGRSPEKASREAIARGEQVFNTKPIELRDVAGLNDRLNIPVIPATCTTCHNSPNVGNHSVSLPLNIGLTDPSRRTPDMPLYTLRNKTTGQLTQTTDPGRALISGKWADIGKFKGPILRALASRPPYFHNGSAATLDEVLNFYETRFSIGLTPQERSDLLAFLRAL